MSSYIDMARTKYMPITNDMYPMVLIEARELNKDKFNESIANNLYPRDTIQKYVDKSILKERNKEMLNDIAKILMKHHTNYRIILGPNYDQIKLNQEDLAFLQKIFSVKFVCDFSGINKYTNDKNNYYEASHYLIETGRNILNEIYSIVI